MHIKAKKTLMIYKMHIKAIFFFSFKANEVFDSVYHCDSILLRILKGVLQILVLILKDHD